MGENVGRNKKKKRYVMYSKEMKWREIGCCLRDCKVCLVCEFFRKFGNYRVVFIFFFRWKVFGMYLVGMVGYCVVGVWCM